MTEPNRQTTSRLLGQYYERWFNNIGVLITQAQLADKGVEEIKAIQDPKSLGQLIFTNLLDVALTVVVPGYFTVSATWRAFSAKNAQGASNVQAIFGLYSAAKDAKSKVEDYKKSKSDNEGAAENKGGSLKVDALNSMIDHMHTMRAEKRKEKEEAELKFEKTAEKDFDMGKVRLAFPPPPDFDELSKELRYAFEWVILRQYVSNSVTIHYNNFEESGQRLVSKPDGLTAAACEKIFKRYDKLIKLEKGVPFIGNKAALEAVKTYTDLKTIWGAKEKEHTIEVRIGRE